MLPRQCQYTFTRERDGEVAARIAVRLAGRMGLDAAPEALVSQPVEHDVHGADKHFTVGDLADSFSDGYGIRRSVKQVNCGQNKLIEWLRQLDRNLRKQPSLAFEHLHRERDAFFDKALFIDVW